MSNQNEIAKVEEIKVDVIVRENDQFVVKQDKDGKFYRQAKYEMYSSVEPKDRKEKMWLLNLMASNEDTGNGLKDHVGKQIVVADLIFNPYTRIDEETGEEEYGVLSYLITPEKDVYITSSKTVYFYLQKLLEWFGRPTDSDWENITLKVGKQKSQNGDIIKVIMVD